MGKMIFLAVAVAIGMAAIASADEVISIDINNYGNSAAYVGQAAVPGATTWIAYDGGWGIPVGSPRSSGLAKVDEVKASTYAAQVWVADNGDHNYVSGAGDGVLDDGFVSKTPSPTETASDPNLLFVGIENFGSAGGYFAYGGTFDLYVYGDSAGSFYLTDANSILIAGPLSVTGTTAGFVEGENYIVFHDISVANPSSVRLYYSNEINGIQLVKKSTPKSIIRSDQTTDPNDYTINAPDYDVAMDTNKRTGESTYYGPDLNEDEVYYIDAGEYMLYDIVVSSTDEGKYNFYVDIGGDAGSSLTLQIFLDGNLRGTVTGNGGTRTPALSMNLLEGLHTLKWQLTSGYANVDDLVFNYADVVGFADCQDVKSYGLAPAADLTGDCRVDLDDLALIFADWALCYDPVNCD